MQTETEDFAQDAKEAEAQNVLYAVGLIKQDIRSVIAEYIGDVASYTSISNESLQHHLECFDEIVGELFYENVTTARGILEEGK